MTTTTEYGRLGNQIIRNLAVSFIAKKHDLFVNYCNYYLINNLLGVNLFIGKNNYTNKTIELNNNNYFDILNKESIEYNLNPNNDFFQIIEISNMILEYLNSNIIKKNIMNKNPFKERYNNNDDVFIHVRLTDVKDKNPGIDYYLKAIKNIKNYENIYLSTDEKDNTIIKQIIEKYPNMKLIELNEINTFQFASTCKNIILSHSTFSAIIGYLSFFSNVYYPEYDKMWHGDIFSLEKWNKICYL
jgi:hypothetical protein